MTKIPLFPLSSVIMPGGLLPLRLFERRYLDMITDCFRDGTGFGVCLLKSGHEADGHSEPYFRGTTVTIIDFDQGSDGLLHITAEGDQEFKLLNHWQKEDGLFMGEVSFIAPGPDTAMSKEVEVLASKLKLILSYMEPSIQYSAKQLDNADWVCHRLLELLPLDPPSKMEIVELPNNRERLAALAAMRIEISS